MSGATKAVVTGAGGYIGRQAAYALGRKYGRAAVRCLVRQSDQARDLRADGFDVSVGDLVDPATIVQLVEKDAVLVHAAAALGRTPWSDAVAVNVMGTRHLAEAALAVGVPRFIHISTIEAYGHFGERVLVESQAFQPNGDTYSTTKALAEQVVIEAYAARGKQSFTILRLGAVYGPNSPYWTRRYLEMAKSGRIVVLGRIGRIYPVYEDDVTEAIVGSVDCPEAAGEVINVVNDEGVTWWEWADAHHRLAGRGRPRLKSATLRRLNSAVAEWRGKPGQRRKLEVQLRQASIPNKRANQILGWTPRSLSEGMRCILQNQP